MPILGVQKAEPAPVTCMPHGARWETALTVDASHPPYDWQAARVKGAVASAVMGKVGGASGAVSGGGVPAGGTVGAAARPFL